MFCRPFTLERLATAAPRAYGPQLVAFLLPLTTYCDAISYDTDWNTEPPGSYLHVRQPNFVRRRALAAIGSIFSFYNWVPRSRSKVLISRHLPLIGVAAKLIELRWLASGGDRRREQGDLCLTPEQTRVRVERRLGHGRGDQHNLQVLGPPALRPSAQNRGRWQTARRSIGYIFGLSIGLL